MEPLQLAHAIADALEDKKGENIVLLDLRGQAPVGDYNVICSGNSDRTIHALMAGAVEAIQEKHHIRPRLEGSPAEGWLLADYGSVVVHVLSDAQREYYRLEDLWSEAKVLLHLQ